MTSIVSDLYRHECVGNVTREQWCSEKRSSSINSTWAQFSGLFTCFVVGGVLIRGGYRGPPSESFVEICLHLMVILAYNISSLLPVYLKWINIFLI